jgi:excisionase family DNA binding protein
MSRPEPLTLEELRERLTRPLTIAEYAATLGISKDTAYEAAARGEFRVLRKGRRVLVPATVVLAELGYEVAGCASAKPVASEVVVDE